MLVGNQSAVAILEDILVVSYKTKHTFIIEFSRHPRWHSDKESACHCRRCRGCEFDPWVEKIPWSRKWQHALTFLLGKFHGQRSRWGYSLWGCKESDTTERTHTDAEAFLLGKISLYID